MKCRRCGEQQDDWGCVALCDRCLCARLWEELERDDYILIRRTPGSDRLWLSSQLDGTKRGTDLTALNLDLRKEVTERINEVFG